MSTTIYLFYTPDLPPIFRKKTFATDEDALEYGSRMILLRRIIKVAEYDEANPDSGTMSFLSPDSGPTNGTRSNSRTNSIVVSPPTTSVAFSSSEAAPLSTTSVVPGSINASRVTTIPITEGEQTLRGGAKTG
jgi:hypothetical protein